MSDEIRILKSAVQQMEEDLEGTSIEMVEIIPLAEAASREKSEASTPMPSGFSDLDSCLKGGFREGDLTLITGVSGEGKTTLGRMFTLNLAKAQTPSLWFSYEMSTSELWEAFEAMGASTDLISFVPVTIEQDLAWILAHAKEGITKHGTKAIFIDTLGDIIKYSKDRNELNNGALMLSNICKALRMFAIKEKVMIFLVAHAVKTGMRKDVDKETYNDDVAYSAGIVQAATNVFHVWRRKNAETIVKIGKSRRDGTAHGKKLSFLFRENNLIPEGYAIDTPDNF